MLCFDFIELVPDPAVPPELLRPPPEVELIGHGLHLCDPHFYSPFQGLRAILLKTF